MGPIDNKERSTESCTRDRPAIKLIPIFPFEKEIRMFQPETWTQPLAALELNAAQWGAIAIAGVTVLVTILFAVAFARTFCLWFQAFMSGANITLLSLVSMKMRRAPVKDIVRWKIMATQAGVTVTTRQLEAAALQGVDVERAVLAMIRAKQNGQQVTWEEVIATDTDQRLRERS